MYLGGMRVSIEETKDLVRCPGKLSTSALLRGLLLGVVLCGLSRAETWQQGPGAFTQEVFVGTQVDSLGKLSLASFQGANLAFGIAALSGQNTLTGSRSVTECPESRRRSRSTWPMCRCPSL